MHFQFILNSKLQSEFSIADFEFDLPIVTPYPRSAITILPQGLETRLLVSILIRMRENHLQMLGLPFWSSSPITSPGPTKLPFPINS